MLRRWPRRVAFCVVGVSGIIIAGPGTAVSKPKVKTACGNVVTTRCDQDARKPSLMLQSPHKAEFVFVELAWIDDVSVAEQYEGAEICGTGLEEKRKHDRYLRVDDRAQLRVVRDAQTPQLRFGDGAHRICEADIEMPIVKREVRPNYTRAAMEAKIQGSVLLEAVVQTNGSVGATRIIRSLDTKYGLDSEAIRACQAWVFEPAQLKGSPVPIVVTMELSFTLK